MAIFKKERNYIYNFYLYCDPYLLFLDDDSVIDLNIDKFSIDSKKDDVFKIETLDIYFHENLKRIEDKEFLLIFQTYDLSNKFLNQIEICGEEFYTENNILILKFDSISINNVSPSLNPYWLTSIDLYKKERVSYLRNIQIETLLN